MARSRPRSAPAEPAGLDTLGLDLGAATATLPDLFATAQTDAFLVLHRGVVVHEAYPHGAAPHDPHFNASVAKSYLGLLAGMLAREGLLDRSARTDAYVPELASGIHGQRLFVSPGLDLVVVHFGSQVISPSVPVAPFVRTFPRIGAHLAGLG
ncbi:hypothetical protein [Streptomyces nogalater]|uniref:Beta-lactamase-related domain-containing protein n=1 Tax=Streptomyces nogalater TaxID=38314 RepID=A0ABW0WRE5_STRNO